MKKINDLENLAKKYRSDLFEKLLTIKQGHPGSIFSMMEEISKFCRHLKQPFHEKKFNG